MKILFANKFFFRKGGSETVMFDEIDLMKKANFEVVEFSMHDPRNLPSNYSAYFVSPKDYRSGSTIDKISSGLSLIRSQEAIDKFTKLALDEKPDILHCHNIYHQLTPSIINVAARLGIPVVLTLHDYKLVCPVHTQLRNGEPCTKCVGGRFEEVLIHRCADGSLGQSALLWAEARYHELARSYNHVDIFIAPSQFMRKTMLGRFKEDKLIYLPNGIDASRIQPSIQDEGFVLFFGRVAQEKGVETLLQAHAEDGAAWRLVIAGTGPLLDDLQSKFPRAEFVGYLTGKALESTISKAALVVAPSEFNENHSLSILEAMAYAKPIVGSRVGGIPELVRPGETGLLFERKNRGELIACIRQLMSDPDLRKRLGAGARRAIESEYSLETHGAALRSLYEGLASA